MADLWAMNFESLPISAQIFSVGIGFLSASAFALSLKELTIAAVCALSESQDLSGDDVDSIWTRIGVLIFCALLASGGLLASLFQLF